MIESDLEATLLPTLFPRRYQRHNKDDNLLRNQAARKTAILGSTPRTRGTAPIHECVKVRASRTIGVARTTREFGRTRVSGLHAVPRDSNVPCEWRSKGPCDLLVNRSKPGFPEDPLPAGQSSAWEGLSIRLKVRLFGSCVRRQKFEPHPLCHSFGSARLLAFGELSFKSQFLGVGK